MNEYTTLDELWDKNKAPFFVSLKNDRFKRLRKVTGKTLLDNSLYEPDLYWVDGRLICRADVLKPIWKIEKSS